MANDVIKSFDEEVAKNEELQKSKDVVETTEVTPEAEVAKSTEPVVEDTNKEDVAKSTEVEDKEVSKSEKPEDEEAEKTDTPAEDEDKEVEKSEDSDKEPEKEVEKSVEPKGTEDVAKSDVDFEALLEVVIKSYSQLANQVNYLTDKLDVVAGTQAEISKSIEDSKVTPIQEAVAKSIETGSEEVTEKAVGYAEKSSFIDDEAEELSKSNVETATNEPIEFTEVEAMFKSKFAEASKNITSARDENALKEVSKSWQRFINDRSTSEDTDRINGFLNK